MYNIYTHTHQRDRRETEEERKNERKKGSGKNAVSFFFLLLFENFIFKFRSRQRGTVHIRFAWLIISFTLTSQSRLRSTVHSIACPSHVECTVHIHSTVVRRVIEIITSESPERYSSFSLGFFQQIQSILDRRKYPSHIDFTSWFG